MKGLEFAGLPFNQFHCKDEAEVWWREFANSAVNDLSDLFYFGPYAGWQWGDTIGVNYRKDGVIDEMIVDEFGAGEIAKLSTYSVLAGAGKTN